jgi:hypothetical protein
MDQREDTVEVVAPPPAVPEFVLYVHPNSPQSMQLYQYLQKYQLPQVFVQDVTTLQNKPSWLDGVPILADTKIGLLYRGSDAITFVNNLVGLHVKTQESKIEPVKREDPPEPSKSSTMDDLFNDTGSSTGTAISLPSNAHRYNTASQSKVSATSLNEYQNQRSLLLNKHKMT